MSVLPGIGPKGSGDAVCGVCLSVCVLSAVLMTSPR